MPEQGEDGEVDALTGKPIGAPYDATERIVSIMIQTREIPPEMTDFRDQAAVVSVKFDGDYIPLDGAYRTEMDPYARMMNRALYEMYSSKNDVPESMLGSPEPIPMRSSCSGQRTVRCSPLQRSMAPTRGRSTSPI